MIHWKGGIVQIEIEIYLMKKKVEIKKYRTNTIINIAQI